MQGTFSAAGPAGAAARLLCCTAGAGPCALSPHQRCRRPPSAPLSRPTAALPGGCGQDGGPAGAPSVGGGAGRQRALQVRCARFLCPTLPGTKLGFCLQRQPPVLGRLRDAMLFHWQPTAALGACPPPCPAPQHRGHRRPLHARPVWRPLARARALCHRPRPPRGAPRCAALCQAAPAEHCRAAAGHAPALASGCVHSCLRLIAALLTLTTHPLPATAAGASSGRRCGGGQHTAGPHPAPRGAAGTAAAAAAAATAAAATAAAAPSGGAGGRGGRVFRGSGGGRRAGALPGQPSHAADPTVCGPGGGGLSRAGLQPSCGPHAACRASAACLIQPQPHHSPLSTMRCPAAPVKQRAQELLYYSVSPRTEKANHLAALGTQEGFVLTAVQQLQATSCVRCTRPGFRKVCSLS